jgi:hypothetical protein
MKTLLHPNIWLMTLPQTSDLRILPAISIAFLHVTDQEDIMLKRLVTLGLGLCITVGALAFSPPPHFHLGPTA